MKVTLLALTLNERDGVKAILPRIPRRHVDPLLVVDGGSTDGTIEWVRANGYALHVQRRRGIRYAYPPLVALLVGLYFLWVRGIRWPSQRFQKSEIGNPKSEKPISVFAAPAVSVILMAGLGVLSLCSAAKIHGMTRHICAYYRPLRMEMAAIQKLIDEHGQEAEFAISFDPDTYYSLEYYHGLPRVHILFARYVDHENPTHVICGVRSELVVKREEDYRREHGRRYQCLPKFIETGSNDFMVFQYQDHYYGLHFEEGCFRADREDYLNLLEGDSVAEVVRQIPEAVRQINEESKCREAGCFSP